MSRKIVCFVLSLASGCSFQPGDHRPLPQVLSAGGPVLVAPRLTAVSFAGDPLAPDLESFVAAIGGSSYWQATTLEYGVGAAVASAPVHVADPPPAKIADGELQAWLASMLDGTHADWPAPVDGSVYVVSYPQGTVVTSAAVATSCASFSGYHSSLDVAGRPVAYVVLPRCPWRGNVTAESITQIASHELIEAATDPFPVEEPGFIAPDPDDFAWGYVAGGGEVGDLCQKDPSSYVFLPELGHLVQRTWSNAAAAAGHDPCVPAPPGDVWFAAMPVVDDPLALSFKNDDSLLTRGIQISVGAHRRVELQLFSDAPTQPFSVWAQQYPIDPLLEQPSDLRLSIDRAEGSNGDTLVLDVAVDGDGYGEGHQYVDVIAQLGDQQHRFPFIVGNE